MTQALHTGARGAALVCLGLALGGPASAAFSLYPIDMGTGLSALGLVPIPGQTTANFWGGSTLSYAGAAYTDAVSATVTHAAFWQGTTLTDLHPAAYQSSGAVSVSRNWGGKGAMVAGFVSGQCNNGCATGPAHAAIWTPGGFVDLHPAGYKASFAQGNIGNNVVGWVLDSANVYHPGWWAGAPAHFYEMTVPSGFGSGAAIAIDRVGFVGWSNAPDGKPHPIAWYPEEGHNVPHDILPPGATNGVAAATFTKRYQLEVGGSVIFSGTAWHAAYWRDAASNSAVDLHPADKGKTHYSASSVYVMRQVGASPVLAGLAAVPKGKGAVWHAMVWNATAKSAKDLHLVLNTSHNWVQSVATGIDELGNIEGAAQDQSGVWHDIYWQNTAWPQFRRAARGR